MIVMAIDPGCEESGVVWWDGSHVLDSYIIDNYTLLKIIRESGTSWTKGLGDNCVIEVIASYGMPVGKEVFATCFWIGRFTEAWEANRSTPVRWVERPKIKLHHCHSPRAKDSNIRQALIDKYGAPGTSKKKGKTYGIKSHLWAALALATFVTEGQ